MRIYLHFPFCLAKCPYCDFYSIVAGRETREAYLETLLEEMSMVRRERSGGEGMVESVYCGGGTPSLYSPRELGAVLDRVRELWTVSPGVEMTVEINPATWSGDQLLEAASEGFNRFSIGAQSFDDGVLSMLDRQHGAAEARSLAGMAVQLEEAKAGLDLIYGVPGQSLEGWERTLEEAVAFKPRHVSAYALTLDPSTPMGRRVGRGELALPEEGLTVEMYETACRLLRQAGYRHYEISNFALPGQECGHNLACWKREDYLGMGASAHSFLAPDLRPHNLRDVDVYMEKVRSGESPVEEVEHLDPVEVWEEEILLSLRTSDGMEEGSLTLRGPGDGGARAAWEGFITDGLAWRSGSRCGLTERGMFVSNHIISRLFAG